MTAVSRPGALTRRTGASRGSLSAAGWASPSGAAAASCLPGGREEAQRLSGRSEAPAASGGEHVDAGDQSAFRGLLGGPGEAQIPGGGAPTACPVSASRNYTTSHGGRLQVTGFALLSQLWQK